MKITHDELLKMAPAHENYSMLKRFAFMGKDEQKRAYFEELANLAEIENWSTSEEYPYDILQNYITYTFDKIFSECEIVFSNDMDYCCFNTGLLTSNGEDILCMFNRFEKSDKFYWHIQGFKQASHRDIMNCFDETPAVAKYFNDASKIYFDANKEMLSNLDHILDENIDRFSDNLKEKGKSYILALLKSSLDVTMKKCKRNYRIAVPNYYKNTIMYLLPIELDGDKMALAVELVNNRYRANTIFTLEMAYKNARLLMKPEADWLNLEYEKGN